MYWSKSPLFLYSPKALNWTSSEHITIPWELFSYMFLDLTPKLPGPQKSVSYRLSESSDADIYLDCYLITMESCFPVSLLLPSFLVHFFVDELPKTSKHCLGKPPHFIHPSCFKILTSQNSIWVLPNQWLSSSTIAVSLYMSNGWSWHLDEDEDVHLEYAHQVYVVTSFEEDSENKTGATVFWVP